MRLKFPIAGLAFSAALVFAQPETWAASAAVAGHVMDTYLIAYVSQVATVLGCY